MFCKQHQCEHEQWDVQRKRELYTGRPSKRATPQISPPVDETSDGEECAHDGDQVHLCGREIGCQGQHAQSEPYELLKGVLQDATMNLQALALLA